MHHPNIKKVITFLILIIFFSQSAAPVRAQTSSGPSFKEQKEQEGYIINLKDLIKRSKAKIEKVNDKLKEQAKKRRNQQREEKAREYYEKAMRLSQEGKLEEAQELWKKAIKITEHPEMKGYISESVRKTKKEQDAFQKAQERRLRRLEIERGYSAEEVERAYNTAVKLYKQKKLVEAKNEFERVEDMFPDHKATRSYLMIIEQEIQSEQTRLIEEKLREEAIARRKEKEKWKKELERRERERKEYLNNQAEGIYKDAVKLYRTREFEKAKERFKEVEWILPNYKSTVHYLSTIDDDIRMEEKRRVIERKKMLEQKIEEERLAKQKEEERRLQLMAMEEEERVDRLKEEAEFVYNAALNLYRQKDYLEAKQRFEEVQKLIPDYKATTKYLKRSEAALMKQEEESLREARKEFEWQIKKERLDRRHQEELLRKQYRAEEEARLEKLRREAELLYDSAVSLYNNELYPQALEKFLEVDSLYPDYKSTKSYEQKIESLLKQRKESTAQAQIEEQKRLADMEKKRLEAELENQRMVAEEHAQMEAEKKKAIRRQAAFLYKTAISLYKERLYVQAKEKFQELQELSPGYKATERYLKRIARKISDMEEKEDSLPPDVTRALPDENTAEVIQKAVEQREQKLLEEAQKKYAEAFSFYKSGRYEEAKRKFIQVEALYPDYKDTLKYLARIDRDILSAKEQKIEIPQPEPKVSPQPQTAVSVSRPEPSSDVKPEDPLNQAAEEVYKQALKFYKEKEYMLAKEKFTEAGALVQGYKRTEKYLKRIEKRIVREQQLEKKRREREQRKLEKQRQRTRQKKEGRENQKDQNFSKDAGVTEQADKLEMRKQKKTRRIAEVKGVCPDPATVSKEPLSAECLYQDALSLYRKKLYRESKDVFKDVEAARADYKLTRKYLRSIDEKIQSREATENQCLDVCMENCMRKCFGLDDDEDRVTHEFTRTFIRPPVQYDLRDETHDLYKQAVVLYRRGLLDQAKARFLEVNHLIPNYGFSNRYLRVIEKKMTRRQKVHQKKKQAVLSRKEETYSQKQEAVEKQLEAEREKSESELEHRVKILQLKQKRAADLKGKQRKEYLAQIKKERRLLKQIRKDQRRQEKERRRRLLKRLKEEEFRKKEKEKEAALLRKKQREEREQARRLEIAERKKREALERKEQDRIDREKREMEHRKQDEQNRLLAQERRLKKELEKVQEKKQILNDGQASSLKETAAVVTTVKTDSVKKEEQIKVVPASSVKNEEESSSPILDAGASEKLRKLAENPGLSDEQKKKTLEDFEYEQLKNDFERKRLKDEFSDYQESQRELRKQQRKALEKQRKEIRRTLQQRKRDYKKRLLKEAGYLYKEGLRQFKLKHYYLARDKFIAAGSLYPGYKRAESYISKCERMIVEKEVSNQKVRKEKKVKLKEERAALEKRLKKEEQARQELEKQKEELLASQEQMLSEEIKKRKRLEAEKPRTEVSAQENKQTRLDVDVPEIEVSAPAEKKKRLEVNASKVEVSDPAEKKKRLEVNAPKVEVSAPAEKQTRLDVDMPEIQVQGERKKISEKQAEYREQQDKDLSQKAGEFYGQGLSYYKGRDYRNAIAYFEAAQKCVPGYKAADRYIDKAKRLLVKQRVRAAKEKEERRARTKKMIEEKKERIRKKKEEKEKEQKELEKEKVKGRIDRGFQKALSFYEKGERDKADAEFDKAMEMLSSGDFSLRYLSSMKKRMERKRAKAVRRMEKEEQKKEKAARKRRELELKRKQEEEAARKRELEKMEAEIRREEERLAKVKEMEKERLEEERKEAAKEVIVTEKKVSILDQEREERIAMKYAEAIKEQKRVFQDREDRDKKRKEFDEKQKQLQVEEKQDELKELIWKRQEELVKEREQIRSDFNQHIAGLYKTAETFYDAGSYRYSVYLFHQIEEMSPDYQKTRDFIKSIEKKDPSLKIN